MVNNNQVRFIFIFIFFVVFNLHAQELRPFLGFSKFLEHDFSRSTFYSAEAGIEVKIMDYIKPDVEVSFMFGSIDTEYRYDEKFRINSSFSKRVHAINFSFCPKIFLGKEESLLGSICLLPKYSISRIQANGIYFEKNDIDTSKSIEQEQTVNEILHSLGFGIGIQFEFSDDSPNSLFLNVYYNRINLGSAISSLNHNTTYYNTDGNLGIGLKYYFGIKNKS